MHNDFFWSWKPPEKQGQRLWETQPREYLKSIKRSLKMLERSMRTRNTFSRYWAASFWGTEPQSFLSPFLAELDAKQAIVTWLGRPWEGQEAHFCANHLWPLLSVVPRWCHTAVLPLLLRAQQSTVHGESVPPCLDSRDVPGDTGQWHLFWFCLWRSNQLRLTRSTSWIGFPRLKNERVGLDSFKCFWSKETLFRLNKQKHVHVCTYLLQNRSILYISYIYIQYINYNIKT